LGWNEIKMFEELACSPKTGPDVMKVQSEYDRGIFNEQETSVAFGRTQSEKVASC
jgi:hypothetical protein